MPVRMMPDSGGEWPEHLDPLKTAFPPEPKRTIRKRGKPANEREMLRAALARYPVIRSDVTPRQIELGREMERTLVMGAIRGAGPAQVMTKSEIMPAHFREVAGRLACAFARHDALAGASKAIADALAIAYEQGRRHPGTGFASLEKADWAGVVEAAKCPPRS